jgi:hypothetical protein
MTLDVPSAILQRRSIESFKSDPIAPLLLRQLVELTVAAESLGLSSTPVKVTSCLALMAFNILSTVKAALKDVHGAGKIESGLSNYYVVEEVQSTFRGMKIAIEADEWKPFAHWSVALFAEFLRDCASHVTLKRFLSSPRGPK